jgi:hypothetical protein
MPSVSLSVNVVVAESLISPSVVLGKNALLSVRQNALDKQLDLVVLVTR